MRGFVSFLFVLVLFVVTYKNGVVEKYVADDVMIKDGMIVIYSTGKEDVVLINKDSVLKVESVDQDS